MKKTLLALAVLGAFAGAASAQSNVTIYGSFDGGIRSQKHSGTPGATTNGTKTSVSSNGTYNSNRLGFKGVEDLGGGLNAHFTLESGFNTGTGALDYGNTQQLFNRTASVGIGGDWGSLDFGRQYSISFKTLGAYDPFNFKFSGLVPLSAASAGTQASSANPIGFGSARFNNDIQYTGKFGPVTAYAEYALGEVAGNNSAGRAAAVGLNYANGPFSVGGAYTARKNAGVLAPQNSLNTATAASEFDNKQWVVGTAYKIGAARVAVGYMNEKQDLATGTKAEVKNAWGGLSYAFTPALELTGAYYQTKASGLGFSGRKDVYIVGATYALSKRTNFYADIDHNKYKDGAVGRISPRGVDSQTGVSVGINHLF